MGDTLSGWKKIHFEILSRIDEICRQCDVNVLLCDDTALQAYNEGTLSDNVTVAIDARDAHRFIEAFEEVEDLGLRGMFNYPYYSGFNMRVYKPGTIDFNIRTYRDFGFCGLYVTVKFIRHVPNSEFIKKNWERFRRAYGQFIRYEYYGRRARSRKRALLFGTVGAVANKDDLGRRVFDTLVKTYSRRSKHTKLGINNFDSDFFESTSTLKINGRDFTIPEDIEEYLKHRYGFNWRLAGTKQYKENLFRFRDANHTWEEYQEYIDYLDFNDYYENLNSLDAFSKEYRKVNRAFSMMKRLTRRTHLRFVFWHKYMPMKDELMELYERGEMEELKEILEPYITSLVAYGRRKMTIIFDKDIFDIAVDILDGEGEENFTRKLKNRIPPEHLEPIRIKNYKGDYIGGAEH